MQTTKNEEPDFTMLSRRWSGEALITIETAIELARRVHQSIYGAEDLLANEPLTAKEDGDSWVVQGSKNLREMKAGDLLDGPMIMKISRYDAQILSYMFGIKVASKR